MSVKGTLILLRHLSPVKLRDLRSSPRRGLSDEPVLVLLTHWRICQVKSLVLALH